MRKVLYIAALVIVALLLIKMPIKEAFHESLVRMNITKRCYDKSKDFDVLFEQEGIDYVKNDRKVTAQSLQSLLHQPAGNLKIPTISHHVYFTSTKKPLDLSDFYIEKIKANFNRLNEIDENWQHFLWTNQPNIFPAEILEIKGVQIKNINEFQAHYLYPELREMIDKGETSRPFFAEGSDLIRLMALQKFGGVYNDMDYEIYNPEALYDLMKRFDFLGGREVAYLDSYYGNAFLASKPNHPVINEALRRNLRNHDAKTTDKYIPNYVKYPCRETTRIYFNGPPLITMAYFSKNNIDGNVDVILPTWMIFNAKFAHLKNNQCGYARMPQEEFLDKAKNLDKLIDNFSKNPILEGGESHDKALQNIYYNTKYNEGFPIIGADMFCGSWVVGKKFNRKYYWSWK